MLQNLSIPCFQPQKNDRGISEEEFTFRIINQNQTLMPQISNNISLLDLTGNLFTQIPEVIYGLKLKKLILRENRIIALSSRIQELSDLLILDLSHNFLQNLPQEIVSLQSLTHLNLNSNCFDQLPDALFNLKVRFLGIAKNSFQILPKQFLQMLISIEILDFDWLQYGIPKGLTEENKRLLIMTDQTLNFEQFYQVLNIDMKYEYCFEQIFQNQSLGILKSYYKLITYKNLVYCYHQQKTEENNRFIKYLIHLIQYQYDLVNTMFILSFKFQNLDVFMYMLNNFQLDYHYASKYDLLFNSHIILLKGQMLFTFILLKFNSYMQILPLLIENGFNPNHKTDKGNCLHQSVLAKNIEAVEWSLKYCDQNSKEPILGNNCLHIINSHNIEIIELLFNSNCNPLAVNKLNKIPRQCVADVQQLSFYKIFQRYENLYIKKYLCQEQNNQKHAMINYYDNQSQQENNTLILLSKLLRTKFKSKAELIPNLLQYYYFTQDEQSKLLTALIILLILNKLVYGLQYKSVLFSSILFQINDIPIFNLKYPLLNDMSNNSDYQYLIQQIQQQVKKQYTLQIQNIINPQHQSILSQKLQYDLNNLIDKDRYHRIYQLNQQQFVYRSYINQHFIDNYIHPQMQTNLLLLDQYEQFQQYKKQRISVVNDFTTAMDSPRSTLVTQMENFSQYINPKFKQNF